mgnify:CR=1 FL=1
MKKKKQHKTAKKIFCSSCKKWVPAGNFCSLCGRKLVHTCDCWITKLRMHCKNRTCWGLKFELELFTFLYEMEKSRNNKYPMVLNPLFQRISRKTSSLF